MRVRSATLAALTAVLVMTAIVPAVAQESHSLRRVFRAGETDRYRLTMNLERGEVKLDLTLQMTETTREVRNDGSIVIEMTMDSGSMLLNGTEVPIPNVGQKVTFSVDKDGKPIKGEQPIDSESPLATVMALARSSSLPDRPIRVGETVRVEVPIEGSRDRKLAAQFTLVGIERRSEEVPVDTLRVRSVIEGLVPTPDGDQNLKIEATSLYEPGTGKVVRVEGVVSGFRLVQLGPEPARLSFKRLRLPAERPAPR
ncbi:MAG TPA: hypothetical protein VLH79_00465 [Chthonomonadales bacterium]|nr:hypothetical protein [Chthonomonadales bacterium]